MKKIIVVAGPTASGKTSLAIELAKSFNGEIISADSMQLYRKMDIGTAKPTNIERQGIPHHLIDTFDISESFSVSDYVTLAKNCTEEILKRRHLPILCGGTGLYIDSFVTSNDFGNYENLPEYRKELTKTAEEHGGAHLLKMLSEVDPECAARLHENDVKRIIRALEVFRSTGITLTEWQKNSRKRMPEYHALMIGLRFEDRQKLYERINKRVDLMIESGLIEEAAMLRGIGLEKTPTAGQAIGYKELYPYLDGKAELNECVEELKRSSRRYAKRQMTWFHRNPDIKWLYADQMSPDELTAAAKTLVSEFLKDSD